MKKYTVRPLVASLAAGAPLKYQVVKPSGQIDEIYNTKGEADSHAKRENEKLSHEKRHLMRI